MKRLATSLIAGITLPDAYKDARQEAIEHFYREFCRVESGFLLRLSIDGEMCLIGPDDSLQTPLRSLLDGNDTDAQLVSLKQAFEKAGIRALLFLPDLDLLELEVALDLIRDGGEYLQLKLMERLVHRVVILNTSPMLLVNRPVSDLVTASLDVVFLTMTGIDRVGCGDEHGPDHVLSIHGKALISLLDEPKEIVSFLASLDLVLHSYPAEVQRGVLKLMAQGVPSSKKSACEDVLELFRDAPEELEGVRKGVIESVLSSMRGEEVPELSMARRPARVRRIEGDTQPGPTLPIAIPPPLLPVEEVAELSQSAPNPRPGKERSDGDGVFAFASHEKSLPGIVLEPEEAPVVLGEASEAMRHEAMEDRVATYRERSSQLLARAASATSVEYPQCIRTLTTVAAHLLDSGEYQEAWGILRFLLSETRVPSRHEHVGSLEALNEATKSLLTIQRAKLICDALPHAEFGEQSAILELLHALGPDAMPAMLQLNATYYLGPTLRRSLFAVMENAGEKAGDVLAEYLRANKTRLHRLTPLIEILGTLDRGRQRELLIAYSRHPVPAVRKSALTGLYRSLGKDGEPVLLDALKDEDPSVCQTAITLLAASRCMLPDFIAWLHHVIVCPNPTDVREEGVLVAALRAVGLLGNVPLTASLQVEDVLLDRIGVSKSGWLRRTARLENDLSPRVQEALCATLGFIGTYHSMQALTLLLNDGQPAVRARAKEALDRIRARGSLVN